MRRTSSWRAGGSREHSARRKRGPSVAKKKPEQRHREHLEDQSQDARREAERSAGDGRSGRGDTLADLGRARRQVDVVVVLEPLGDLRQAVRPGLHQTRGLGDHQAPDQDDEARHDDRDDRVDEQGRESAAPATPGEPVDEGLDREAEEHREQDRDEEAEQSLQGPSPEQQNDDETEDPDRVTAQPRRLSGDAPRPGGSPHGRHASTVSTDAPGIRERGRGSRDQASSRSASYVASSAFSARDFRTRHTTMSAMTTTAASPAAPRPTYFSIAW